MKRGYLALGAAVVLAAVIGLIVLLRTPDARPRQAARPAEDSQVAEADRGKVRVTHVPSAAATPDARSGAVQTDYTVGGVRIRDHRTGTHAPIDLPPAVHPMEGRKVSSALVNQFAQKLRGVVTDCATRVPSEGRGPKPRADGEIRIAIKAGQATITRALFQLRDVGGTVDAAKQCLEEKSVSLAIPSGDEPDVEDYSITVSLILP